MSKDYGEAIILQDSNFNDMVDGLMRTKYSYAYRAAWKNNSLDDSYPKLFCLGGDYLKETFKTGNKYMSTILAKNANDEVTVVEKCVDIKDITACDWIVTKEVIRGMKP